MSQPNQRAKVTIEDLLRLKRAERPSPDFWTNFERDLRQKQLTALVQKRRWWHEIPRLLNRRIYLPAGAAAIIAFTVITIRYAVPSRIAQSPNAVSRIAATVPPVEMLESTEVAQSTQNQRGLEEETVMPASDLAADVASTNTVIDIPPPKSVVPETKTPPAHTLVASLSRLEQPLSDLVESSLGSQLSAPARGQSTALNQSEVATMTPVSTGKYQLVARYGERSVSPAPSAPAVVRERLARRLGGDDLGDSISRIGVVGSQISLKF
jgi:hypothetical protein